MSHPIRNAAIHTFERTDGDAKGPRFMARFHPYSAYPIFFSGDTEAEVIAKAEVLRSEAIEKHEAACLARQEAQMKSAETRARKAKETSK